MRQGAFKCDMIALCLDSRSSMGVPLLKHSNWLNLAQPGLKSLKSNSTYFSDFVAEDIGCGSDLVVA